MALALPSSAFSDVQRQLRQRRAGGQTVTPRAERLAWQAYWDVNAARSLQSRGLSMQEKASERRFAMDEKRMKREESAAKVAGVAELGSMAAMGAYALKGTSIGAKIGLGGPAAPAVSKVAGPTVAGGAAATAVGVEAGKTAAMGAAGAGTGTYGAAGTTSAAGPLAGMAGPAAAGAVGGFIGSELGEMITGNDAGEVIGGLAGGAAAGFAMSGGNPIGAIVGGIIGGAIGVVKAIKD